MKTDFAAVRVLLELAREELRGIDPTSEMTKQALDLLIEAIVVEQHRKAEARVIPFPKPASVDATERAF